MAATNSRASTSFSTWLEGRLKEKGWSERELSRQAAVAQSQVSRWGEGATPKKESIRAVCAALGVPAVEGFIAAGYLVPEDVGATIETTVVQLQDVTDRELVEEVARRFEAYAQGAEGPTDSAEDPPPARRLYATNESIAHLHPGEQLAARRDERGKR